MAHNGAAAAHHQAAVNSRSNLNNLHGVSRNLTRNNLASANNSVNGGNRLNNGGFGLGNGIGGGYGLGGYGGGSGYGGYGYGNRGYGYGNGGYVMVYWPRVGWVMVPRRAIRRF